MASNSEPNENERKHATVNLPRTGTQKLSLDPERIKSSMKDSSEMTKVYEHSYREATLITYVEALANAIDQGEYDLAERLVQKLEEDGVLKRVEV